MMPIVTDRDMGLISTSVVSDVGHILTVVVSNAGRILDPGCRYGTIVNIHEAEWTDHRLAYSGRQSRLGCSENARIDCLVETTLPWM